MANGKPYSAGDLEISIEALSGDAMSSIDQLITKLTSLSTTLQSLTSLDFKWINSLGTKFKNFGKKMAEVDWATVENGFKNLTTAVTPFIDKIKEAEVGLNSLHQVLKQMNSKKFDNILGTLNGTAKPKGSSTTKSSGKSNLLFTGFKIGAMLQMGRRLGAMYANLVQDASAYNETLNLWQVSMRDNLDIADEFIKKMNKAYGISEKTLMNAQAIFKNMVGNLGNISDATAYALSETLVQMSADFSSLFNVSLESAFQKFQAVLSRQVRPIRSVSGYDITENTIYELYQQLGGTKTMRQLNNTEKQLLAIYAVFKQMGASGALGDMTKTLNQFANQSRMMTEYWSEMKIWAGIILKDFIDQNEILVYINAGLIFLTNILKSIAKSKGLGDENYIDGIFTSTENTLDAMDELQGKLLDFDKFRSLNSSQTNFLGIDEKLLDAITGYSSKIDDAVNKAQQLADEWAKILGLVDNNGDGVLDYNNNMHALKQTIDGVLIGIGILVGAITINSFVILGKSIYANLITPLISFGKLLITEVIPSIIVFMKNLSVVEQNLIAISGMFLLFSLSQWLNTEMSAGKRMITLFLAIAGAITAAVVAMNLFGQNYIGAFSAAAIVAGTVFTVSSAIPNFEKGASNIDSGTVFRAGEFGKTEAVYTGSNGKTNVANVTQMEQAFYNALIRYAKSNTGGNSTIVVTLDGETVYRNTTSHAKLHGYKWAKV